MGETGIVSDKSDMESKWEEESIKELKWGG